MIYESLPAGKSVAETPLSSATGDTRVIFAPDSSIKSNEKTPSSIKFTVPSTVTLSPVLNTESSEGETTSTVGKIPLVVK